MLNFKSKFLNQKWNDYIGRVNKDIDCKNELALNLQKIYWDSDLRKEHKNWNDAVEEAFAKWLNAQNITSRNYKKYAN
jgi:hypothetical protein